LDSVGALLNPRLRKLEIEDLTSLFARVLPSPLHPHLHPQNLTAIRFQDHRIATKQWVLHVPLRGTFLGFVATLLLRRLGVILVIAGSTAMRVLKIVVSRWKPIAKTARHASMESAFARAVSPALSAKYLLPPILVQQVGWKWLVRTWMPTM